MGYCYRIYHEASHRSLSEIPSMSVVVCPFSLALHHIVSVFRHIRAWMFTLRFRPSVLSWAWCFLIGLVMLVRNVEDGKSLLFPPIGLRDASSACRRPDIIKHHIQPIISDTIWHKSNPPQKAEMWRLHAGDKMSTLYQTKCQMQFSRWGSWCPI